jgi:hypothetical protein
MYRVEKNVFKKLSELYLHFFEYFIPHFTTVSHKKSIIRLNSSMSILLPIQKSKKSMVEKNVDGIQTCIFWSKKIGQIN